MKKLLVLLLAFALLLPALVSCQDDGPDTPDLPEGNPVLLVLPEDVNMISIYLYGGGNGGAAYFDKNNYGVLLQLLEELRATTVIPLADENALASFPFDDCIDVNIYGTDGALMQISVDKQNRICIGQEVFVLAEGALSYKHVQSYYEEFCED
ncbi:MAG: hypothetical protein E7644_00400 [Ruminococcaceae bacterium]|nr:hypothetical protein [Oscillospiraceae bacterium]